MPMMYYDKRTFCQNPAEFQKLLYWASGANSILEIGCRYGTDLLELVKVMSGRNKRVVAVDMPNGPWGYPDSEERLKAAVQTLKKGGYDAHLFLGKSQDTTIREAVKELGPFDFTFIDGDHRYTMVKQDWEFYGPMSKKVAFHDIQPPLTPGNAELGVYKLWNELKDRPDAVSYIDPGSPMGVACIG